MNILSFLLPKSQVVYIDSNSTIRQGLEKMKANHYTAMPVIDKEGHYFGTVNDGDFLWYLYDAKSFHLKELEKHNVSEIVRKNWNPPVKISATMDQLLHQITEQNFVPVIDDRGVFIGIITRKTILQSFYRNYQAMLPETI